MQLLIRSLGFLLVSGTVALAQVPEDFYMEVTTGGLNAFDQITSFTVDASGRWRHLRYVWDDPDADSLAGSAGVLNQTSVETLWEALTANGFGFLDPYVEDPTISDGAFTLVRVFADGVLQSAESRNVPLAELDAIVEEVNAVLNGAVAMEAGSAETVAWTEQPICDVVFPPLKRSSLVTGKGENRRHPSALQNESSHPGSFVGNRIDLAEAVRRGIVALTANGGIYGPQVTLAIDNSDAQHSGDIRLSLFLEIHGSDLTDSDVPTLEGVVQTLWEDFSTSTGAPLPLDVTIRIAAEDQSYGTEGFHQVRFVDENAAVTVTGKEGALPTGGGTGLVTLPSGEMPNSAGWGHIVGHLFGLTDPVRYYRKDAEGLWVGESADDVHTAEELAALLAFVRPWRSAAEHLEGLNRPGALHVTLPLEGHETDLMATLSGSPRDIEADLLADNAGLVVDAYPGDILLNKNLDYQNFGVTRREQIFVERSETKETDVYVACIDFHDEVPEWGQRFDMAPPLSDWQAIDAAPLLDVLLSYIDRNERFCASDVDAQNAIWRLTDNHQIGEPTLESLLADAGIESGTTILDFPRLSNPAAADTSHVVLVPLELYVANLTPASVLTKPGMEVQVSGQVTGPLDEGEPTEYGWTLTRPPASTTELVIATGSAKLVPDLRGMYEIGLVTDAGESVIQLGNGVRVTAADAETDTFERGSLSGGPVAWMTGGTNPWKAAEGRARTGTFAAASAAIADTVAGFSGDSTAISVRFETTREDTLAFAVRVSSEEKFDVLKLKVNGVALREWSGETGWLTEYIPLGTGEQLVEWCYVKDEVVSEGEDRAWIDDVFFPNSVAIAASPKDLPELAHFGLESVYPNPFAQSTTVRFSLSERAEANLLVVDALGRIIRRIDAGVRQPGVHTVVLDEVHMSNGVYFVVLEAGSHRETLPVVHAR